MKVLVTGASGQLGRETVLALQKAGHTVIAARRDNYDFSVPELIADKIAVCKADWVINCAAYTQVDKAESESEQADKVNRDSARAVAEGVDSYGGRLLHVSTDFIFSGEQSNPYKEEDVADPQGIYGLSKWQGEQAVLEVMSSPVILRTAWVYGIHGHNFVKTMLRLASERDELRVVDDQIGTPSWTADISKAMLKLMDIDASGVFHFTNEGVASWYDFANQIILTGKQLGFPIKAGKVTPIATHEFPVPAKRPAYSVLSKEKIRPLLGYSIPHWSESLLNMLQQLKGGNSDASMHSLHNDAVVKQNIEV